MIEVDYTYYTNEYRGMLTEEEFNRYLNRAYIKLKYYTNRGILDDINSDLEFEIKMSICMLIDAIDLYTDENGVESNVTKESETLGPWSIKYSSSDSNKYPDKMYTSIIKEVFSGTRVLNMWI